VKIFISWSGKRSNSLAEALRDWIPLVLHYVEPWLSQTDIEAGQRWAEQVAKELETSNFGIVCITQENVSSPWVLFEAGALAKSLQGSRVIPFLLDMEFRDITGPLAQFQAKKADRTGMHEVIQSLNQLAAHPVPEDRVTQLFEALWPELEKKIAAIPKASGLAKHTRPQSEILEELVASVRTLDSKFREVAEEGPRVLRHRSRRFHPMMIRELSHLIGEKPGDPVGFLVLSSLFREEMPWLYELGMEAYRASKDGTPSEARSARKKFLRAAELMRRGPFPMEEFGVDPRMVHMVIGEMDHLLDLDREIETVVEASETSSQKSKRKKNEKLA
jgi:TIR domain